MTTADDARARFVNVEGSMSEALMTERRTEASRDAESVVSVLALRQALYNAFMTHFGCDEQDPDEILAAERFRREVFEQIALNRRSER